jgi:hypothetical protein
MSAQTIGSLGVCFRHFRSVSLVLAMAGALLACNGSEGEAPELDGVATLALTVADGVASVKVDFQGATRAVSRCVEVDGAPTTQLHGLPTGTVLVSAAAYSVPGCQGDPTWVAEPQTVVLVKGQPLPITIVFRPNGIVVISTTYVDDSQVLPCPAEWDFVPREAMAQTATGPAGTGLRAVYDDGDIRDEGPIWFGPHEAGWVASYYPADRLADSTAPALWQTISGIGGETLTGYIVGPRNGTVNFNIGWDDYVSMELGNGMLSLLADNTGGAGGSVVLQAGVYYPVTLRYMNRWGTNGFTLSWSCPAP